MSAPRPPGPAVLVAGALHHETVVRLASLPLPGANAAALGCGTHVAGRAAVVAAGLARLGASPRLLARAGTGLDAARAAERFTAMGVDPGALVRDREHAAGIAFCLVDGDGRFIRATCRRDDAVLQAGDLQVLPARALDGLAGAVLTSELPAKTARALLGLLRPRHVPTVFLYDRGDGPLPAKPAQLGILVVNQGGLAALSARPVDHVESARDAAVALLGTGFQAVVATLGERGAVVAAGGESRVVPTAARQARNRSFAADAFAAALVWRVGQGEHADADTLAEAAGWANAAAGLAVGEEAEFANLPDAEAVTRERRRLAGGRVRRTPLETTLRETARQARGLLVRMLAAAGSGHPGGSLSAIEILAVLYFAELRVDPKRPAWDGRDRFVLSKGHAAPALYVMLALRGFFPAAELDTLRRLGSRLQGHPDRERTPGVDVSTGSLGQGLSIACGLALANRLQRRAARVYALLGDGELEEGQVWEAAMTAAGRGLDNLVAIVDFNGLQIDGSVSRVKGSLEPLAEKWRAFGWHVVSCDGHDVAQLLDAFRAARAVRGRPVLLIAHTVKGKGVSFMERVVEYHGSQVSAADARRALAELAGGEGEGG